MQLFVAPVSIKVLHKDVPILVGNVVPCSVPIITSSVCSISYLLGLKPCCLFCGLVLLFESFPDSHWSSSVRGISLSFCSKSSIWVALELCSSFADSSSMA